MQDFLHILIVGILSFGSLYLAYNYLKKIKHIFLFYFFINYLITVD